MPLSQILGLNDLPPSSQQRLMLENQQQNVDSSKLLSSRIARGSRSSVLSFMSRRSLSRQQTGNTAGHNSHTKHGDFINHEENKYIPLEINNVKAMPLRVKEGTRNKLKNTDAGTQVAMTIPTQQELSFGIDNIDKLSQGQDTSPTKVSTHRGLNPRLRSRVAQNHLMH